MRPSKRDSVTTVPIRTNSSNSFEYSMTMASMVCSSFLIRVPTVRCARYPIGKRANVRHLTDDNGFVFHSDEAKAEPPSFVPPETAGFFIRGIRGLPDVFRPVKAFAQTPSFVLPGI